MSWKRITTFFRYSSFQTQIKEAIKLFVQGTPDTTVAFTLRQFITKFSIARSAKAIEFVLQTDHPPATSTQVSGQSFTSSAAPQEIL
jgi:hypothetical protein